VQLVRHRRIPALLASLYLSLLVPTATIGATPEALAKITIKNFGAINDAYFRGAQPKGHDFADLAALGVRTVIDLTRDGDPTEQGIVEKAGMRFVRIPLTTTSAPPAAAVEQFLAIVNDPARQPVFVHCQGGRHRTGVMTAIYRLTHDSWSADRAFDEMKRFEFEKGFVSHNTLKQFVYGFYEKLAAKADETAARR